MENSDSWENYAIYARNLREATCAEEVIVNFELADAELSGLRAVHAEEAAYYETRQNLGELLVDKLDEISDPPSSM